MTHSNGQDNTIEPIGRMAGVQSTYLSRAVPRGPTPRCTLHYATKVGPLNARPSRYTCTGTLSNAIKRDDGALLNDSHSR